MRRGQRYLVGSKIASSAAPIAFRVPFGLNQRPMSSFLHLLSPLIAGWRNWHLERAHQTRGKVLTLDFRILHAMLDQVAAKPRLCRRLDPRSTTFFPDQLQLAVAVTLDHLPADAHFSLCFTQGTVLRRIGGKLVQ